MMVSEQKNKALGSNSSYIELVYEKEALSNVHRNAVKGCGVAGPERDSVFDVTTYVALWVSAVTVRKAGPPEPSE